MRNAYYEVLRTYWRRPMQSWWVMLFLLIVVLMMLASIASPHMASQAQTGGFFWPLAMAAIMLWRHLQDQIAREARTLAPGFAAPHVIIFVAFVLMIVIIWPGLMIWYGAPRSTGTMAYVGIWMAVIGWWVLTHSSLLFFAGFGAWIWTLTDTGEKHFLPLLDGRQETLAATLLALSLVAIALAIFKMLGLTEENPLYHRRLQFSGMDLRPRMTGEVNQMWMRMEQQSFLGIRRRVVIPTGNGFWARTQRWRALTRSNVWGLFVMAILVVASMRLASFGRMDPGAPQLMGFLVCGPAMMSVAAWHQMWRFLEADFLRPIGRADFIREIGLAMFLDMLRGWACLAFIIAADSLFFGVEPGTISRVLTWAWLSLLLQIPAFASAVWLMRYRSPMKLMFGAMGAMGIPIILLIMAAAPDAAMKGDRRLLGFIIVGIAMAGFLVLRDAYRRWLGTELG